MDMQAERARWNDVGRTQMFSVDSLKNLIKNVSIVASVKHVSRLGAFENAPEWEQYMNARVGNEPIVRLMFVIFRDMQHAEIRLDEVMALCPAEYVRFFEENQIPIYYEMFPPACTGPTGM
jgi:hypothetical protein